jgi:hypothetical protein
MVTHRRRFLFALSSSAALMFALAGIATAHSGDVIASETCQSWNVSVSLANNVTPDRTVVVVTTIPGTTGIAGNHYNTSFGQIWDASGPAPAAGTVTLNIYKGASLEFTTSAKIEPAKDCDIPTAAPTVTASPFQSFQGETATPTQDPTPTPFQSFQGETATPAGTATPPPTSSGGDSSGSSQTPLMALLICLAFAGVGLMGVEAQRVRTRR